jgi:hypothetical protein
MMSTRENNQSYVVPEQGTIDGQMGHYRIDPMASMDEQPAGQGSMGNMNLDIQIKDKRSNGLRKIAAGLVVGGLAIYGGYNAIKGMFEDGGNSMQAEVTVEETRVTVYENPALLLAGIESDLDLEMTAGYDRTGPFGIDINPINNEYSFSQENLTTQTHAFLTVEQMTVEEDDNNVQVTLDGEMKLSQTSIDWLQQDFAGADIKGTSLSFGNELKDKIDNDALEILQASGSVTAACAMRDANVQDLITGGVVNFLKVVNPNIFESEKEILVNINEIEDQSNKMYTDSIDQLHDVVSGIRQSYSGKNDTFSVDVSNIENCNEQNIRIVNDQSSNNTQLPR